MQLAFTASRNGPFPRQFDTLQRTLSGLILVGQKHEPAKEPLLFRHGDCIGGDAAAHDLADAAGYSIIIHPADVPDKLRAFKPAIIIMPVKPPLVRNRDMVDVSERLIACPDSTEEKWRGSGTWATIRYAKKKGLDVCLIFPDGSMRVDVGTAPLTW